MSSCAQTSRQLELGAQWRRPGLALDLAVFEARTDDEIGVTTNAGGPQTFQNVSRTLRRGLAASWLDATYRDHFLTCASIPCNAPRAEVPAGKRIAGAPRGVLLALRLSAAR